MTRPFRNPRFETLDMRIALAADCLPIEAEATSAEVAPEMSASEFIAGERGGGFDGQTPKFDAGALDAFSASQNLASPNTSAAGQWDGSMLPFDLEGGRNEDWWSDLAKHFGGFDGGGLQGVGGQSAGSENQTPESLKDLVGGNLAKQPASTLPDLPPLLITETLTEVEDWTDADEEAVRKQESESEKKRIANIDWAALDKLGDEALEQAEREAANEKMHNQIAKIFNLPPRATAKYVDPDSSSANATPLDMDEVLRKLFVILANTIQPDVDPSLTDIHDSNDGQQQKLPENQVFDPGSHDPGKPTDRPTLDRLPVRVAGPDEVGPDQT